MNGVSPREVGMMSLYELFSTFAKLPQKGGPRITDEEYEEGMAFMKSVLSKIPDVRI